MPVSPFLFTLKNTFCISLDSSIERWKFMENQFKYFGVDVQRWPASTKDTLTDVFSCNLSNEQKGCSQSHINIYRHIINNDLKYALILEDDACFDFAWKTKIEYLTNEMTEEQYNNLNMVLLNASEHMDELFKWKLQNEQYLTGAYIITKKGALWILNNFKDCFFSSDWMTTRLQLFGGNSYSYFPWLVVQKGQDSAITLNFTADRDKVVNCLSKINYNIPNNYYISAIVESGFKKRIFCFWTGDNEMSYYRKKSLNSLKEHSKCEVVLVTPDKLNDYILPEHPLHESYQYLSFTHRADYLRTYFMHFYGGGYSDVKDTSGDWNQAFDDFNNNENVYINGARELTPVDVANDEVKHLYHFLLANCCYIVRPRTKFTEEWYSKMIAFLDEKLPQLRTMNFTPHPQECYENNKEYPIGWNKMLGNIFHKVVSQYVFTGRLLYTVPYPITSWYR